MNDDVQRRETAPPDAVPETGARLDELEHELALSREIRRRLDGEIRRQEARVGSLEAEAGHLRSVLAERERYLAAIERSLVWRAAQKLRRLVGRSW